MKHVRDLTMLNLYLMNVALVLFDNHTVVMALNNKYAIELNCREKKNLKKWQSVNESPKCFNYKIYNTKHSNETFLDIVPPVYL